MFNFRIYIALICSAFLGAAHAQNMTEVWAKKYANIGERAFRAVMEAGNGTLVAVGESKSDGRLLLADHSTGQTILDVRFGGNKDDAFEAVAQTFDGHFLLAGRTASIGKGGSDGWLVEVDAQGRKIREAAFGTTGSDEFRAIAVLPDGKVLLGGYRDGQKQGDVWLVKVTLQSSPTGLAWTETWSATVGNDEFVTLSAMVPISDGGVVFAGNSGKKSPTGSGDAYCAKIDAQGKITWRKTYGGEDWDEGLGLISTREGGFALAGLTRPKDAKAPDAWLVKLGRDGSKQWDKTYGGKDADYANAVLQTDDGGFLLVGATKSQRSGARNFAGFLVRVSLGGDLLWQQPLGGDKEDVFEVVCPLHNEAVIVAGHTDGDTGWMLHLSDPLLKNSLVGIRDATGLRHTDAKLPTTDGNLLPGQSSWLSFRLENTSDLDMPDVRVAVDETTGAGGFSIWGTNYIGKLKKGEAREVHIPLNAAPDAADGRRHLAVDISAGGKALQTFEKDIELRRPKPASLMIAGYDFQTSGTSNRVTLEVTVENTGDSTSRAAEVSFRCPNGILAQSTTQVPMGVVAAHSRRTVRLEFEKGSFSGNTAVFGCSVRAGGREQVNKTLEWQVGSKASLLSGGPIMVWQNPAPHETGSRTVRTNEEHYEVKMTVVSPKAVNTKNIKVKVNGVEMDGSKFNEEDLREEAKQDTKFIYTYKNKLPLAPGANRVQIVVDGEVSDEVILEFAPERANLHIVAIGAQHEDLQFTTNDAKDFGEQFKNQGGAGKLFGQVFVKTLVSPSETDLTGLKQAMFDLAYQWNDGQIKPQDVLVVFVSSHGKIVENRFKILQTGYNPKYDRLALDYKSELLEVLSPINCKKIVLLDACHSGGAKEGFGGVSKALIELAKSQPGVSTLTSCGPTEKSYENAAWQNGAFTEALLEAFQGRNCQDANGTFQADSDRDQILRLGELYDFLRRRVPNLVKDTIPNAPTGQTPFMPEEQLDRGLPIYLIGQ